MSAASVTWRRTLGRARSLYSTALALGGFLAAAGVSFAFALEAADGCRLSLAAVWAASVAPWLPALAALLAMDVWSEERLSGRIDVLLSTAVRERDFVFGKFLGVWTAAMSATVFFLVTSVACLLAFAPSALSGTGVVDFLPALFALAVQGALWCAVSVAMSAAFRHAASAACASLALTVALPRGAWAAMTAWADGGSSAFGELPLDAHVVDIASGVVPVGTVAAYMAATAAMLFVATKCVAALRLSGRGAFGLRISTAFSLVLALAAAALAIRLAAWLDLPFDIHSNGSSAALSSRTRSILAESSGDVVATCFLPRGDARYRDVGRLLRALRRESAATGGARIDVRFVDPVWDLGAAERLVRRGVATDSIVFEKGNRMVALPLSDGVSERVCASTIRRLTSPPPRRNVCWTVGHGEFGYDAYDAFGMSDIARDLAREGYVNAPLDLASAAGVPGDCALVLVAGARDDFSRVELETLDAYLRGGGRLLVLMDTARAGGLASLLTAWGMRPQELPIRAEKTVSGTDVVVSGFGEQPVTAPLRGLRVVLERPVSFVPSATAAAGAGADRIEYSALARSGADAVAAASERGTGAGSDLAIRPTRIVAVGDAGFALNGQLSARANANRDFFLNCVAYLAGTDAPGAGGEADMLVCGMDRTSKGRLVVVSAVVLPAFAFMLFVAMAARRRHRS